MRLTLRTLLAYLNDTLEPDQAREIGKKVNESEYASGLVKRIQDVVRKRRLTTPDLGGPDSGLGPNTVAEYLDNSLESADVTRVERFCLESDLHLAELASVDQVRTLALCEPVEVLQSTKQRMYELGPATSHSVSAGDPNATDDDSIATVAAQRPEVPVIGSTRSKNNGDVELPAFPQTPIWRRLVPYACFLLIGGGWLYLMVNDFFDQSIDDQPTAIVQNDPLDDAEDMGIDPIDDSDLAAEPINGSSGPSSSLPTLDGPAGQPPARSATDPMDPSDETEPADSVDSTEVATAADAAPGTTDTVVDDTNTKPVPEPTDPSPPVAPDTSVVQNQQPSLPGLDATAADAPDLRHLESSGVLMAFDAATSEWLTQPADSIVKTWDRFAVPEPFRGRFEPADTGIRIDVLGGTAAQYLGESKSAPYGLNIRQGRVVLMGDRTESFDVDDTEAVAIATRGHIWRVELLTPETTCGIEILPVLPSQFEVAPDDPGFVGRLYVAEGSVRVVNSSGEVVVVNKLDSVSLPLNSKTDDAQSADAIRSVPEWVTSEMPAMSSATRQYARLFEKEFITGRSIVSGISPRINDRKPKMAELATRCLASIGDSESLVRALSETEHEEARQAAIDGLRSWLTQSADNATTLQAQLGEFFHDRTRDDVYRLLWGFNADDARDSETSRELVLWLDHEHVAIRQLAFNYIRQLTGRTNQYGPSRPLGQRKKSYSNWMRLIERDGALLTD